ncbi:MAG: pilus assembly protein PilM, partial [Armatimonadota bacterium]|nr:pilus assembly protein PilM [Armatimonadota bacterium]
MIGIDIGSGYVKVVALHRRAGKLGVRSVGVASLPAGGSDNGDIDPSAVARAIRNALDSAGLRHPAAMCGLPRHTLVARLLPIPGEPSPRAAQAALTEAARMLPFPSSEAVTGVRMWSHGGEETIALAAAARAAVVHAYRTAIANAGVRLKGLGVGTHAAEAVAGFSGSEPWVLLDIGARSTCMDILADGVLQSTRATMLGGEDLTRAFAADLGCDAERAEEVKRSQGLAAVAQQDPSGKTRPCPATNAWLEQLATEIRLL